MILAVPRHEHALALLRAELSAGARIFAAWVAEQVDWCTGLMPRCISSRGMSCELRISQRSAKRHAAELRRAGLLAVAERGPLGIPRYALVTPGRGVRVVDDPPVEPEAPAPKPQGMLQRLGAFARRAVELVAGPPSELPSQAQAAPVVPFTGGFGPEPTILPRPSFSSPSRGDGLVRGGEVERKRPEGPQRLGTLTGAPPACPDPDRPAQRQRLSHARHVTAEPPLAAPADYASPRGSRPLPPGSDQAAPTRDGWRPGEAALATYFGELHPDDVVDSRYVGPTYASREEARRNRGIACERPPPPDTGGPADSSPHRKCLLLYSKLYFELRGRQPIVTSRDHEMLRRLLVKYGLDATLELIRCKMHRDAWRGGRTLVEMEW